LEEEVTVVAEVMVVVVVAEGVVDMEVEEEVEDMVGGASVIWTT